MKKVPTIALFIEMSREFGRGLIRGVAKYSRLHGPWTFYIKSPIGNISSTALISWFRDIKADGIIMRHQPKMQSICGMGIPLILATTIKPEGHTDIAYMDTDSYLIGQKAAEHFLSRGFQQFAFYGLEKEVWSTRRLEGFRHRLKEAGFELAYVLNAAKTEHAHSEKSHSELIEKWLVSLPKPIGLMACNDDHGHILIDAARRSEISVPEEVSVLGVDNDEVVCDLCNPPLSSIPLHTERAGYLAAELLHKLIIGEKCDATKVVVPVLDVVERQSTDIMATNDHEVASTLKYIRENVFEPASISMIADRVGINSRTLHRRFIRIVGHSVFHEMRRLRVAHIKRLLIETELTITQIADQLGYTSPDHIARYFQQETGQTPAEFRKAYK